MKWLLAWLLTGSAACAACPGYESCPSVDYPASLKTPQARAALADIDRTEAAAVRAANGAQLNFGQLVGYLGEALTYDRSLSARRNEACGLCHEQTAGFAGGLAPYGQAAGVFPGSSRWRTGPRTPQSLAYAAFAPVLAYRPATQDFAGGNFWDSRATGLITGSPAADQTAVPLTSPFEMALPDPACAVRRVSLAPYGTLFGKLWGSESLAITWPANTDTICARPNDGGADQAPLRLSKADRARATLTLQQIGVTVAAFETNLASPFTAKFDAVQAGKARFSAAEQRGAALFTGRARCSACHAETGDFALFTDFSSANIGVPRNPTLSFLKEKVADRHRYVANPAGGAYVDEGLGGFLASGADNNPVWRAQAARFMGAFQVPTLRNVAARPPGVARSYTHNGSFTDLHTVVHFLNTRDVLPVCTPFGQPGVTCWPAPEQPRNVDHARTGNLGLSVRDETDLIAFLGTLSDNFALSRPGSE